MKHLSLFVPFTLLIGACECGGTEGLTDAALRDSAQQDAAQQDTPRRDTSVDAIEDLMTFCRGEGPLLIPGVDGEARCSGSVAADVFRFGLCSCEDIGFNGGLTTDSFDSSMGPYTPGESAGSVGTNGAFRTNSGAAIGGSLFVVGDFSTNSATTVGSALVVGGAVGGPIEVAGDAAIGGSRSVLEATVSGTLTLPEGVDEGDSTYSMLARAPVTLDDPCVCDDATIPDISGFVAWHRTRNENASIGLETDALVRDQTELELPCGRYYFSGIENNAQVTIRIAGRVALFIDGDIELNAGLTVEFVDESGEVDLFISGDLSSNGELSFGDRDRPSRSRIYVDGESVQFNAGSTLVGNVYAPRSSILSNGQIEVFGSVVFGSIETNAGPIIHYDSDILRVGEMCDPPEECSSCGACPGEQTCVDGMCGSCATDADCCAPLVCSAGDCIPLII